MTMVSSRADVTITEGMSRQVSCMSTGIPVPSITWRINNQTTSFFQMDTITDVSFEMSRNVTTGIQKGSTDSVLYIENAQYPIHHGIYECTAINTDNLVNFSSSATITVHIQGNRVVVIIAIISFDMSQLLLCRFFMGLKITFSNWDGDPLPFKKQS